MNRVSFIVRQSTALGRVAGWSENWYIDGAVGGAIAKSDAFLKARMTLCTQNTTVVAIRVQEIGGRSFLEKTPAIGVLDAGQDIPQMAVNCRVYGGTPTRYKYFQLRGLADGMVSGGDFVTPANWQGNIRQWNRVMVQDQWRFRSSAPDGPQQQLISIDADGNFRFNGALTYNPGDKITLLRTRNTLGLNVSGTFIVDTKIDDRRGKFFGWMGGIVSLSGKGRVYGISYPLVSLGSLTWSDVTTRKVGRPFGLYRGRRTSRR